MACFSRYYVQQQQKVTMLQLAEEAIKLYSIDTFFLKTLIEVNINEL